MLILILKLNQNMTLNSFVSAVASLCSSAVVAGTPLVIYPLKTRHHDASHNQPSPLQPVCHRADDLLYNQSATEQTTSSTTSLPQSRRPPTTSLQLTCCRRPLQPVYGHRAADDLYYNQSTAVALRVIKLQRAAGAPQTHHRRRQLPPPQYTTIPQYHNTTIPYYRRCTKNG